MSRNVLWLSSLSCLALSGCITGQIEIQDARTCGVTSLISAGLDCSHLVGSQVDTLTFKESVDFLSPQPARTCVPAKVAGVCAEDQSQGLVAELPARAGAIAFSAKDFAVAITELAVMCRDMGKHCTYATRQALRQLHAKIPAP